MSAWNRLALFNTGPGPSNTLKDNLAGLKAPAFLVWKPKTGLLPRTQPGVTMNFTPIFVSIRTRRPEEQTSTVPTISQPAEPRAIAVLQPLLEQENE